MASAALQRNAYAADQAPQYCAFIKFLQAMSHADLAKAYRGLGQTEIAKAHELRAREDLPSKSPE